MLSPDNLSSKAFAPSIWSFDSGYVSNDLCEEETWVDTLEPQASSSRHLSVPQVEPNIGLGLSPFTYTHTNDRLQLTRDEPAIEPLVTKLSVFTTTDSYKTDFFLPEIGSDGETCLRCEFWRITSSGEDVKCEDCRAVPKIIEPSQLEIRNSQLKQALPSLEIPSTIRAKQVNMATTRTRCSACELSSLVSPNQPTFCPSCTSSPDPGLLSPCSPTPSEGKVRRSRAGRNSKLPLSALNRLQTWLDEHADNPYPSGNEKRQLAQECGITEKQVTTWFTNARARQLSPLDTYLSSGSEDEGADKSDIESAAQTPTYTTGLTYISEPQQRRRAGSVATSSVFSASKPQPSRRGKKKIYRKNIQSPISERTSPTSGFQTPTLTSAHTTPDQEMWQCTFCRRHLVPKSWRRHEETQHRPRSQWTCMLFGPRISFPHRAGSCCAFCMAKDPSEDHFLRNHRIHECARRPIGERTFFRPDHLRQHVKNFHNATLFDVVQARWKRAADAGEGGEGWTCGFCGDRLETWDKRETHIANHFKDGKTMDEWQRYPERPETRRDQENETRRSDESERSHRGLDILRRTFSMRSNRSSQPPVSQPTPAFANAFDQLAVTTGPLVLDGFSQPPLLPNINTDPFMNEYGQTMTWSDFDPNNYDFSPEVLDAAQQTDYDPTLNNMLSFGNFVDHQNPNPWTQG
ncbi:hypothetical protein BDV96DRAFT_96832 [Lophiotrema nucula]|uniref:Homeobox domain-containing protein n=1 Tax=Lophiotrema nucula TaxID=690887 RepID=A0A6A5Z7S3_9PLEO|nr:hypothetical protein BDV96DRAFT_96832 [Lophiotrema nucula]